MKEQRKRVSPREQSGKLPSIHTDRESIDRVSHSLTANQLLLLSIRADSEHLLLLKRSACVCVELRDALLEQVLKRANPQHVCPRVALHR